MLRITTNEMRAELNDQRFSIETMDIRIARDLGQEAFQCLMKK